MTMASFPPVQASATSGGPTPERVSEDSLEQLDFFEKTTQQGLFVNLLLAGVAFISLWPITSTAHLAAWLAFMLFALAVGCSHKDHRSGRYISRRPGAPCVSAVPRSVRLGWLVLSFFLPQGPGTNSWRDGSCGAWRPETLAPLRVAAAAFFSRRSAAVARLVLLGGGVWGATAHCVCLMCFVWLSVLRYVQSYRSGSLLSK